MKQSFMEVIVNNIISFLKDGIYHRIVDVYASYKMDEIFMKQNHGLRTHSDYAEFLGMMLSMMMMMMMMMILMILMILMMILMMMLLMMMIMMMMMIS